MAPCELLMAVDESMLLEFDPCPCFVCLFGVTWGGWSLKEKAIHSNQEDETKFPQGIEPCTSRKI